MKLILASASTVAPKILRDAGFSLHRALLRHRRNAIPGDPPNLVQRLAAAKAIRRRPRAGPAIVIGADTESPSKATLRQAGSSGRCRHMLEKLSRPHHTPRHRWWPSSASDAERLTFVESRWCTFHALREEISRYLSTANHNKAGAYGIQGRAGRYIPAHRRCYFQLVGLPLARLHKPHHLGWSED